MSYEIRAAYKSGVPLTAKQRSSPFFDFAPRVGTSVLRPGMILRLDDAQYAALKSTIDKLLSAEAVVVTQSGEAPAPAPTASAPPQEPPPPPPPPPPAPQFFSEPAPAEAAHAPEDGPKRKTGKSRS